MFSNISRKVTIVGITLATVGAGVFGPSASASAYTVVGNSVPDSANQAVSVGSVACTVNGGDPVVVTVNGRRFVRSTAYLSCNAPVHVRGAASALYTNGSIVTKRVAVGPFTNRTTLSVISELPCNGSANRYWTGYGEFELDMNRDGVVDRNVGDASLANLRSCGL